MEIGKISPFLKWPGGKRWFVNKYKDVFPNEIQTYYEPFLGGGSVFFVLQPKNAVIADVNKELINLYKIMRDNPNGLKELLMEHQLKHSKEYYYQTRLCSSENDLERAAKFLYLNRTCYNGMYRVNKKGEFNVPIGTKKNCTYDLDLFDTYATLLKRADICVDDFQNIIAKARKDDLVFADPPYAVQKKQDGFIKYNDQLFTWNDQVRLFKSLKDAKARGAKIVLTNVDCEEVREMYELGGFFVKEIERVSSIAGKATKRGVVTELLITSYELQEDK